MSPRRRHQVKAALLAATVVVASTMPSWGIRTFLYVVGALLGAVGCVLLGMLLHVVWLER